MADIERIGKTIDEVLPPFVREIVMTVIEDLHKDHDARLGALSDGVLELEALRATEKDDA